MPPTHHFQVPTVYWSGGIQWVSVWVAIRNCPNGRTHNGRSRLVDALSALRSGGTYHLYHFPPRGGSGWLVIRVEILVNSAVPLREAARTLAMDEIHRRLEHNLY